MWRKLGVILIGLLSTFSVAYAMNHEINATSNDSYNAGGAVTGRINKAPAGITGSNIGMQKGDKVLIGVSNPYTNHDLSFQLLYYEKSHNLNNWFSLSNEAIGRGAIADSLKFDQTLTSGWPTLTAFLFANSMIAPTFLDLNTRLQASANSMKIVGNRNLQYQKSFYDYSISHDYLFSTSIHALEFINEWGEKKIFPPHASDMTSSISGADPVGINMPLSAEDLMYSENYHLNEAVKSTNSDPGWNAYIDLSGNLDLDSNTFVECAHRAAVNLQTMDIVFSISKGINNEVARVKEPQLNSSTVYLSEGAEMKARIEDVTLTNTTSLNQIQNKFGNSSNKINKDSTAYLDATAQAGTSIEGVNTVSAIIFDNTGAFKYYLPLESAKGSGTYELDTTGIPLGKYKIGIVNEVYNEASSVPASSSAISTLYELEVVKPHVLTYTSAPQTQATYEYSKNVNAGDKIGTLARSEGVVPITYTIVGDGDESYKNFEIAGLE